MPADEWDKLGVERTPAEAMAKVGVCWRGNLSRLKHDRSFKEMGQKSEMVIVGALGWISPPCRCRGPVEAEPLVLSYLF